MQHRLINVVLAVLMLMPAGICTCDGGVAFCHDHPVQTPTQQQTYDAAGQAHKCSEDTAATEADRESHSHRCPAPCPHQLSCRVVAPEFLADSSESDLSTVLPFIDYAVVVEWPTPIPTRSDCCLDFSPLPASPIYLTNCALLN